jgi:hypothetical protein
LDNRPKEGEIIMKRLQIIAFISLIFLTLPTGVGWPQQHVLFRVSPDGSLIILDKTGVITQLPEGRRNEIDLVGSQLNVRIIRGSSESGEGLPIITRGRGNRGQRLSAPLSPSSQPLSRPGPRPAQVPDTPISSLIDRSAQEQGLDPGLVRLVVQKESGFNPQAVSPKGAMGLMQLMPGTAAMLGVQDPFNPAQNIDGGVRYLKQCLERFDNNVCLALAAYNAGPENVAKHRGVPPFAETRNYVANIMQEYTGQPVDLPAPPSIMPSPNLLAGRNLPKKSAFSQTDLQPLFLPGGDRVNVTQSGKSKIIEIVGR